MSLFGSQVTLSNIILFLQELQKCFETQNIPLLQETISKMPESEAMYHMKRCVDSGLWVPEANKNKEEEEEEEYAELTPKEDAAAAGSSGDKPT